MQIFANNNKYDQDIACSHWKRSNYFKQSKIELVTIFGHINNAK